MQVADLSVDVIELVILYLVDFYVGFDGVALVGLFVDCQGDN
jgi:hypothetical protein